MRIEIDVDEQGADAERLDELTVKLQRRLTELDVAEAERRAGPDAPAGARGDALAIGALLVSIADSSALAAVVREVRGWLGVGSATRRVRLKLGDDELELDGASSDEQDRLVRAFLDRHGQP